ncbi:hypothetical protein [Vibrio diazotrophicus]|uniref:hypothetical protein n=1 Tax=Vibrio diazotrophicus TaxID=685 RepID=UPI000DD8EC28|nr:hypothetical protein [Vibrio diazotrophicus]
MTRERSQESLVSILWGKNEFDAERHQPLLPLKARLKEVTNFLETDNIKTQVLGKIAINYYFSGKG